MMKAKLAVNGRSVSAVFAVMAILAAAPALAAPAKGSAEAELIKLEQDYARALIAKDVEFLKSYYAPDWRGGDWMGFASKTNIINMLRNERYVVRSMNLRDMRVRVLGDIAIVQGVDDEVTSMGGQNTSGTWGWTDVFARRNGRWVAIASHTSKLERPPR